MPAKAGIHDFLNLPMTRHESKPSLSLLYQQPWPLTDQPRHCEERSDEAIHLSRFLFQQKMGLIGERNLAPMNLSIPEQEPTKPDRESVVWGFVLAPFVAALLLAWWAPFYEGEPMPQRIIQTAQIYCVCGAYPLAVILGIPTYKFCRSLNMRPTWLNYGMAGAGIAGIPSFLMELLMTMSFSPGEIARENGHDLVVNGHATLWAWRDALISVSQISAVAFIGGLVFWFITFMPARKTD